MKDPTEFRNRFQSWMQGIPAYENGKPIDYTKVAQESRDREYNTAMSYFKSTPNIQNLAKGVYHFAKSTPLLGDTPASVNPHTIYGDVPGAGFRDPKSLLETTRRIREAVKPLVKGVSNTKLSTQALQQEIRYGDTYYPEQLTIAERNAMPKLRQAKLAKEKGKYVMVDNAPKVGQKNYILMENGRPQAEMIASMENGDIVPEMVYKTNKAAHHTTTDLYSGVLKYQKQAGNVTKEGKRAGIRSGENRMSDPAQDPQIRQFNRETISNEGTWSNEGLVGYDKEPTVVKTRKEAENLHKKGKAYILYNQPVYRLLQPVKDIPIKDRYMFDPRRIGPNGEYDIDMSNPSRFAQNQDNSNQRHYFKGGKDLPRFAGGVDLGANPTNATINSDGTFTDDYTRAFDDFIITPNGSTTPYGSYTDKNWNRYQQYSNWLKYHDQKTGKLTGEPGLELVSPEFDLLNLGIGVSKELSRAHNWGGVRLTPFSNNDKFSYEYLNSKGNPVGYINVTTYDNKPHISMVRSSIENKGISRKLYDAAIQDVTDRGMPGIYSGDNLLSAPKTYAMWKHYPNKKLIRMDGTHNNSNMPGVTGVLSRDMTREQAIQNWKNNKFGIIENGEVYLLDSPSAPVQYWSPYQMSLSNPIIATGNISLGHTLQSDTNYKNGKDIYIKPSHRGRFTALKKRTGHSASWFKAHGTPAQKKMATFELNSRHWRH